MMLRENDNRLSLSNYFNGRRTRAYAGFGISIISLFGAAILLLATNDLVFKGMAFSFLFGSIAFFVLYANEPACSINDLRHLNDILRHDHEKIRLDEFPRMRKAIRNIILVEIVSLALIFLGIGCCLLFGTTTSQFGFGIGIFSQAVLIFYLHYFALKDSMRHWESLHLFFRNHQKNMGFTIYNHPH